MFYGRWLVKLAGRWLATAAHAKRDTSQGPPEGKCSGMRHADYLFGIQFGTAASQPLLLQLIKA
jgi:hypothetical protein